MTDPQVIPYLLYADADAAIDWRVKTFGFTVRARDARRDGSVRHGELQLDGGGVIMVGSAGPGYQGSASLGGVTQLVRITVIDLNPTGTGRKRPLPKRPRCRSDHQAGCPIR